MLKIRLQRFGKRNQPTYRLVVIDSRFGPQSGKFIESVGWHNPRSKEGDVNAERVQYWRDKGVQISDSAHNLLVCLGIINEPKRALTGRKHIHAAPVAESGNEGGEPAPAATEENAAEDTASESTDTPQEGAESAEPASEETPAEQPEEAKQE